MPVITTMTQGCLSQDVANRAKQVLCNTVNKTWGQYDTHSKSSPAEYFI